MKDERLIKQLQKRIEDLESAVQQYKSVNRELTRWVNEGTVKILREKDATISEFARQISERDEKIWAAQNALRYRDEDDSCGPFVKEDAGEKSL